MTDLKLVRKPVQDFGDAEISFPDILKDELSLVAPAAAYEEGESPIKFTGDTTFEVDPRIPHTTVEAAIKRATDRMMKRLMMQTVSHEEDVTHVSDQNAFPR